MSHIVIRKKVIATHMFLFCFTVVSLSYIRQFNNNNNSNNNNNNINNNDDNNNSNNNSNE